MRSCFIIFLPKESKKNSIFSICLCMSFFKLYAFKTFLLFFLFLYLCFLFPPILRHHKIQNCVYWIDINEGGNWHFNSIRSLSLSHSHFEHLQIGVFILIDIGKVYDLRCQFSIYSYFPFILMCDDKMKRR